MLKIRIQAMPQKHKIVLITCAAALSLILVLSLGLHPGVSLEEYVPVNYDEKEIITLLSTFNTAKLERDLEKYLACLCDNGSYMFGGGLIVSKEYLKFMLPEFWTALDAGNMQVFPSSRESLNGNFFDGQLFDPKIQIDGNKAKVVTTFVTPVLRWIMWKRTLFISLQKKHGDWRIESFVWGIG